MRLGWLLAAFLTACAPEGAEAPASAEPTAPARAERVERVPPATFLALVFDQEAGGPRTRLLRLEEPIRVAFAGRGGAAYASDLDLLLRRLRVEASLDIRAADTGEITVRFIPGAEMRRLYPGTACFVVPAAIDWRSYLRAVRRGRDPRWSALERLEAATIFIPDDQIPHNVRACLYEELAQALGAGNDLYALPSSIFNDDNRFTFLTGFDMAVLRRLYAPDLRPGMTRREAAAAVGAFDRAESGAAWAAAFEMARDPDAPASLRRAAAVRAVALARAMRPVDHRLAEALTELARLEFRGDPARGLALYGEAHALLNRLHGPGHLRTAHAAQILAAARLVTGDPAGVLPLVAAALPVAETHGEAILVTRLYRVRADAEERLGNGAAADRARLDSAAWERYAFGPRAGVSRVAR